MDQGQGSAIQPNNWFARRVRSRWESKATVSLSGNGVETLVPTDTTKQRSPDPCPYPSKVDRIIEALGNDKTLLFVTNSYSYGGAEKHLVELVRRLSGCGFQVSILCFLKDHYTERLEQDQRVRVTSMPRQPASFWGWFQLLRKTRPDIAIFIYSYFWSFPWYVPVAAWLAGVPRRFSIQHLIAPAVPAKKEARPIRNLLWRLFGGRTPRIMVSGISQLAYHTTICVSNAVRNTLVSDYRFPSSRTITIYNGVSVSEFDLSESNRVAVRNRLGLYPNEFVLVCAARLSEEKGIDILLSAIARLVRNGTACKCIIVGDGPLREVLAAQARELGLAGHVFFEGFQNDVRTYLQAGTAFVLTSHVEGLPLAILEAMSCGLPCIVTDVGGNSEAVAHGVNGLVIPAGSVEDAADAISYLETHPEERAQMSIMARARACEKFDIEDSMAGIVSTLLK